MRKCQKRVQSRIDARTKACLEAREQARKANPGIPWEKAFKLPGSRNPDKRK